MGILDGKKVLIFGIANDRSIAYGIAGQMKAQGAELALSYAGGASIERRVKPIAEELGVSFCEECDLSDDNAITELADKLAKKYGTIDCIVHSVAFAPHECLAGRYADTARADFLTAMNISVYTLVAVVNKFEKLLSPESSVITLTYYGAEKVVPNYNVMGVAKAALEASVRYLAVDMGKKSVRVNAISAGPIKTVSAAGVSGFRSMLPVYSERAPLGRNVDINDCGACAAFLASDLSKNITGEVIHVDSGYNIVGF